MDPEAFRAESRDRWERSAAGWEATRERLQRDAAPVTEWLLDAARLTPGMTVLEVAAGAGETGLQAARRVAPGGRAILTDGAEAMVAAIRRRAAELGLDDVEVRPMEAEWLDLPAASVDALLCRWGLMLLADPEAALREWRRVLRPGGRLALAVWAGPEANPWLTRLHGLLVERGLAAAPEPGEPGPFSLGDAERLADLLWGAGVTEVRVEAIDLVYRAASLDEWWEHATTTSQRAADAVAGLSPAEHYALRDAFDTAYAEFTDADGRVAIPGRTLVATAEA
jgi:SAM-dependent methyltransferase